MVPSRTRRQLPTRAIIAGVFAFLFVLQWLALAASPAFAGKDRNGANHSFIVSTTDGYCSALGNDKGPAHGRHDHSQCCIFCKASGRDATFAIIAASICVAIYLPSKESVSLVPFAEDDCSMRPIGWTSSWSSRAPPSFS
jgi:hypothetical protein